MGPARVAHVLNTKESSSGHVFDKLFGDGFGAFGLKVSQLTTVSQFKHGVVDVLVVSFVADGLANALLALAEVLDHINMLAALAKWRHFFVKSFYDIRSDVLDNFDGISLAGIWVVKLGSLVYLAVGAISKVFFQLITFLFLITVVLERLEDLISGAMGDAFVTTWWVCVNHLLFCVDF